MSRALNVPLREDERILRDNLPGYDDDRLLRLADEYIDDSDTLKPYLIFNEMGERDSLEFFGKMGRSLIYNSIGLDIGRLTYDEAADVLKGYMITISGYHEVKRLSDKKFSILEMLVDSMASEILNDNLEDRDTYEETYSRFKEYSLDNVGM